MAAAALLTTTMIGCGGNGGSASDEGFDATVRTTTGGIPHIKAADYGSLGYGIGYVQARDNLCVLAEEFLTIKGQRAEFLGRDGSYTIHANGATASNVDSDFFWRFLISDARLQELADAALPEAEAASRGYAAGFSRYVKEIKRGQHAGRHQSCRNAAWVRPIDLSDMYRRYIRLGVLASSSVFPTEIANAAPPAAGAGGEAPDPQDLLDALPLDALPFELPENLGSNMYGFGADATQNGQSMLFGNPHFPWRGTERLYQMQLTLTGNTPANIFGSSLYGVPAVLIGFNEHLAWSHTVSTAFRFSFYELKLNPADPTQYLFDGEFVDMESEDIRIQIQEADGSLTESSRTLYRSRFGPMLELSVSGVPVLSWNGVTAYTLRDANLENTRLIEQFFRWNRADSRRNGSPRCTGRTSSRRSMCAGI
ncbi:MAG: penicillin acylase family protein, partial [Algiphilus sp.]